MSEPGGAGHGGVRLRVGLRPPRERARRPGLRAGAAVALAAACLLGALSGTAGAHPGPHATTSPGSSTVAGSSFGARAGYSASYLVETQGLRPATGRVPVEVTFAEPLAADAYRSAVGYFEAAGLTVTGLSSDRLTLSLDGTATAVGAAFGTEILAGTYRGSGVRLPADAPSLPAPLESEVAGVVGLSSGFTGFSFDLQGVSAAPADPNTVTPALARQFYGFSTLYNLSGGPQFPTNLSVAVVLWGEGYAPSDINTFLSDYYPSSFPQPKIVNYPVDGAPPPSDNALNSPDSKAVEELTLDIEWALSTAPGATIDVVYAPDGGPPSYSPSSANLTDALSEAVSLDPAVISMSFGTDESSDSSLVASWTPLFQQAESRGTTILAATGDTGGDSVACSGTPAPEYPASSPQVIAVGGTDVTINYPFGGGETFSETAWNDSGGGYSGQFSAPSWQSSYVPAIAANGHRGTPDVSATAADNFLYFDGGSAIAGGTSFATPLWAGLVADLDAKWQHLLGFFTPNLYHVGANEPTGDIGIGIADVTGGGNCVANATTGWDAATGWGSPRAAVLYDDLLGSFVNITLVLDRTTIAPGGSVSVSALLTNRTSHAPIVGVPVDLTIAADTDLGPCTGVFRTATPETNATGWASATLSVPACYLGQHAQVNASVTTTSLYGETGALVAVNLLGFYPALEFLSQAPWVYVTYVVIVGAAVVVGAWIGRPRIRAPPAAPPPGALLGRPAPPSPPTGSPAAQPVAPAGAPPAAPPAGPPTPSPPDTGRPPGPGASARPGPPVPPPPEPPSSGPPSSS